MRGKLRLILPVLAAVLAAAPAGAAVELVESCSDTMDAVVVNWDCDFEDLEYVTGETVSLTVSWTVEGGTAMFEDFTARGPGFTPRSRRDAVEGTAPTIVSVMDNGSDGSVTVEFIVVDLHETGKGKAYKGNAHFSLLLRVDDDGDGLVPDNPSRFGVNVHVTDPAEEEMPLSPASEDPAVRPGSWGSIKSRYGS